MGIRVSGVFVIAVAFGGGYYLARRKYKK